MTKLAVLFLNYVVTPLKIDIIAKFEVMLLVIVPAALIAIQFSWLRGSGSLPA